MTSVWAASPSLPYSLISNQPSADHLTIVFAKKHLTNVSPKKHTDSCCFSDANTPNLHAPGGRGSVLPGACAIVLEVLAEARMPLSVEELTNRILAQKLCQTTGKTPQATVGAMFYADIKRRGEKSVFILVSPNVFGLRSSPIAPTGAELKQPSKSRHKTFSFTESAIKVLEKFGNKRPMH